MRFRGSEGALTHLARVGRGDVWGANTPSTPRPICRARKHISPAVALREVCGSCDPPPCPWNWELERVLYPLGMASVGAVAPTRARNAGVDARAMAVSILSMCRHGFWKIAGFSRKCSSRAATCSVDVHWNEGPRCDVRGPNGSPNGSSKSYGFRKF